MGEKNCYMGKKRSQKREKIAFQSPREIEGGGDDLLRSIPKREEVKGKASLVFSL